MWSAVERNTPSPSGSYSTNGIGLSSLRIDTVVHALREFGALGAKLTGAGGDGGAVIGLFYEPEHAAAKLRAQGLNCFTSQVAGPLAL